MPFPFDRFGEENKVITTHRRYSDEVILEEVKSIIENNKNNQGVLTFEDYSYLVRFLESKNDTILEYKAFYNENVVSVDLRSETHPIPDFTKPLLDKVNRLLNESA